MSVLSSSGNVAPSPGVKKRGSLIRALVSSTGSGCRDILSGTPRDNLWVTDIRTNAASSCVLELRMHSFLDHLHVIRSQNPEAEFVNGYVIVSLEAEHEVYSPTFCRISTSDNSAFGFNVIRPRWEIGSDEVVSIRLELEEVKRYLCFHFYGTSGNAHFHRLSSLSVHGVHEVLFFKPEVFDIREEEKQKKFDDESRQDYIPEYMEEEHAVSSSKDHAMVQDTSPSSEMSWSKYYKESEAIEKEREDEDVSLEIECEPENEQHGRKFRISSPFMRNVPSRTPPDSHIADALSILAGDTTPEGFPYTESSPVVDVVEENSEEMVVTPEIENPSVIMTGSVEDDSSHKTEPEMISHENNVEESPILVKNTKVGWPRIASMPRESHPLENEVKRKPSISEINLMLRARQKRLDSEKGKKKKRNVRAGKVSPLAHRGKPPRTASSIRKLKLDLSSRGPDVFYQSAASPPLSQSSPIVPCVIEEEQVLSEEEKEKLLVEKILSERRRWDKWRDANSHLFRLLESGTIELQKFSFRRSKRKPQKRFMTLREKSNKLFWGSRTRKERSKILLSDIQWIVVGPRTEAFKKYLRSHSIQGEYRCFSIKTAKRTLDFLAPSVEVSDAIVLVLQCLTLESIMKNNRPVYSRGRLLWKRLKLSLDKSSTSFFSVVVEALERAADETATEMSSVCGSLPDEEMMDKPQHDLKYIVRPRIVRKSPEEREKEQQFERERILQLERERQHQRDRDRRHLEIERERRLHPEGEDTEIENESNLDDEYAFVPENVDDEELDEETVELPLVITPHLGLSLDDDQKGRVDISDVDIQVEEVDAKLDQSAKDDVHMDHNDAPHSGVKKVRFAESPEEIHSKPHQDSDHGPKEETMDTDSEEKWESDGKVSVEESDEIGHLQRDSVEEEKSRPNVEIVDESSVMVVDLEKEYGQNGNEESILGKINKEDESAKGDTVEVDEDELLPEAGEDILVISSESFSNVSRKARQSKARKYWETWRRDHKDILSRVSAGIQLKKLAVRKNSKRQTRYVRVQGGRLYWGTFFRRKRMSVPLSDIQWIVLGPRTKTFGLYLSKKHSIGARDLCCSIKLRERTLDLIAPQKVLVPFILVIQSHAYECIIENDRPLYAGGELFWRILRTMYESEPGGFVKVLCDSINKTKPAKT